MKEKLALFLCMAVLFSACGGADSDKVSETAETAFQITIPEDQSLNWDYTSCEGIPSLPGARIAVVTKEMDQDFWKAAREGAEQAVNEINRLYGFEGEDAVSVTFEGIADGADVEGQINQIDAVLSENPTALCISAVDVSSCQPQLEAANDNGIPVIALDSGVDSPLITTTCATDNFTASGIAMQKLCEKIGEAGEIALVSHAPTAKTAISRVNGFNWKLSEYPDVQVGANLTLSQIDSIEETLGATLDLHPDLEGIFCTNEQTASEVLEALEKIGKTDLTVVGFDAGEKQRAAVESGAEYGLICQNPRAMGYASVTAAVRAAAGQEVDRHIETGYRWIDKETLNLEENRTFLY